MNIVRELRKKRGIQQKELAIEIGVSNATVSDWEHGRKNPSGERLRKLADFFGVTPDAVLGNQPNLFIPENPRISGKSETDQILERILTQLDQMPKTTEARIVSYGMDKLPQEQREQILGVVRAMFPKTNVFEGKEDDDAT